MKKQVLYLPILLLLLLSGCGNRNDSSITRTAQVNLPMDAYTEDGDSMTFDENIEAFVLNEDDDFSLFAPPESSAMLASNPIFESDDFELEESDVDMNQRLRPMYFGYDSKEIKDDQYEILKQNVQYLVEAAKEGKTIIVKTNRCICGSESYIRTLSDECSRNVAKETRRLLTENGIDEKQIKIKALGVGSQEAQLSDESGMTLAQRKAAGDPDHNADRWAKFSVINI